MEDYNELSFVIRQSYMDVYWPEYEKLGGRWNPNLVGGPGWIFNKKRHTQVVRDFFRRKRQERCCVYTFINIFIWATILWLITG